MKELTLNQNETIEFDRCGVNVGSMSFDLPAGKMTRNIRSLTIDGFGTAYKFTIHDIENKNYKWILVNA